MKKILCFSLAIFILTISILIYCPINAFASYPDDYYSLSKPYNQGMGLSSADAQAAVNAHKDIADSRGILCFQYTPTEKYNWTVNTKITQNIHLSDNQLKQLLMSKHAISAGFLNFMYGTVNSNAFRGFISGVGLATRTDSDTLLGIADKITGNYNYLDAIDYNEDTQTIVMSNDNSAVDKLREEIKKYYYDSIGLKVIKPVGTVKKYVDSSDFRKLFEYEDDYTSAYSVCNADYAFVSGVNFAYFSKGNKSNLTGYYYMGNSDSDKRNSFTDWTTSVYTYRLYSYDTSGHSHMWEINNESYSVFYNYEWDNSDLYTPNPACLIPMWVCPYYGQLVFNKDMRYDSATTESWRYRDFRINYYSADNSPFSYFSSYSAMYNYLHGDQTAYISSVINQTGKDISMSIDNLGDDLGQKLDSLIYTINTKKEGLSADELQNLIDSGLKNIENNTGDIKDNTGDIKDNTSNILDTLKEQNNILLQILGVTEYIAYQNDKYNNTYTKADMSNLFKKSFNRVSDAVLYGEKVDDDNENTVDRSKFSYHNGIFGHFPFSVPYQLYEWLKVFQAEPECPEFTYHYGFLIGISKDDDEYDKYKITFNLSAYESWREVAASLLKLSFTLTMAIGTYKKFKGEL